MRWWIGGLVRGEEGEGDGVGKGFVGVRYLRRGWRGCRCRCLCFRCV